MHTKTNWLCIPKQFFKIASESCKKLTKLTFVESKISNFISIHTLTELTLYECKALSWMNFKQILSEMNLSSFVTYRTYYRGKVEPFTVSKSLRHFEFDFPERFLTGIFIGQFRNLTSFRWVNADGSCIRDIASNFPNLQKLSAILLSTLDDGVFKLTSLHSVKTTFHISSSVLLKLLKHPTLQILSFAIIKDKNEVNAMDLEVPKTNLANISTSSTAFIKGLEFWLDLLAINPNLTLICQGFKVYSEENVFTEVVKSAKFPPLNRTSIKVSGFIIDCADLKNNFDANMKKIKQIDSVLSGLWLASNIVF